MLSKQQMEATVLLEVERIRKDGKGYEGTFVELKRSLPEDRRRAARQLAAICNAARGEQVLWLIGLDDKTGEVHPPSSVDIQDWWPGVVRYFDDVPPDLSSIAVSVGDGETVLALFFETDRAPYVVTTDGQGQAQLEVPWRDGTTTRSAKRRELLRMLAPAVPMPEMDLLQADVIASHFGPPHSLIGLELSCYVFMDVSRPIALPRYRQAALITIADHTLDLDVAFLKPENNPAIAYAPAALRIDSPTLVELFATGRLEDNPEALMELFEAAPEAKFSMTVAISGSDSRTTFENTGQRTALDPDEAGTNLLGMLKWRWAHR